MEVYDAAVSSAGRRIAATALAATIVALAPSSAAAELTELKLRGGTLTVKGGNAVDEIAIAADGRSVVIDDPAGVPEADSPCKGGPPSSVVRCPRGQVDEAVVDLGDGDDVFDGDGDLRFEVDGDRDDDTIDGGDARDLIEGKFGNDEIDGSDGSDRLFGGVDDDIVFGKAGRDLVDGGPGTDEGDGGAGKDKCSGLESDSGCERNVRSLLSADR